LFGIVFAAIFAWLATEHAASDSAFPAHRNPDLNSALSGESEIKNKAEPMFPTSGLWFMFIAAAIIFLLRDFTGTSMATVGSLFLQKARGFDVEQTGVTISFIFIASAISNPLFGHFSDRSRLKWAAAMIVISAVFVVLVPHMPTPWIIPTLLVYGFFFMASYPIIEAALMESVPDSVRGRVFGLFITIGGLLGNLSHWIDGKWVQNFGERASDVRTYYSLYGWLALFLLVSLAGLPCLHAIRKREEAVQPGVTHHTEPMTP
jgi:MFS family permease